MPLNKEKRPQVQDRREEILRESEELFREQGFLATSIEAITKRVGIAHGTFYRYFQTKDDLLIAIAQNRTEAIRRDFEKLRADRKLTSLQKLLKAASALDKARHLRVTVDYVSFGILRQDPAIHEKVMNLAITLISPELALLLEQGNENGDFTVANPKATAVQLILLSGELIHRADMTQQVVKWPELFASFKESVARMVGAKGPVE